MNLKYSKTAKLIPAVISLLFIFRMLSCFSGLSGDRILAFLTCTVFSNDTLSVGTNTIEIQESGGFPDSVTPGSPTSSDNTVSVRNTGTVPCFVRMKIIISNSRLSDHITFNGLNTSLWDGSCHGPGEFDPDSDDRLFGYYYYTDPLDPGSETVPLLTGIYIDSETDESMLMNYGIRLYAESIQAGSDTSWRDAWEGAT